MPFASKWDLLTIPLQNEILTHAKEFGISEAVKKYWLQTNMTRQGLGRKLTSLISPDLKVQGVGNSEVKLSKKEKDFIKKIRTGEVSGLEEVNKFVMATVYEKMLKNPHDVKFIDLFRSQLLELKKQEQTDKNNMMQDLVNRMFSGNLPPTTCPHCHKPLYQVSEIKEAKVIEGELLDE